MRPKEAKQYVRSVLEQWRPVFGCGDVDDADSTSDLVLKKHRRENSKHKRNSENTKIWLSQVSNELTEQYKIERSNTDLTTESQSAEPSIPSTIESCEQSHILLVQANPINASSRIDEPIPAVVQTMSIDSFPNTDVTGDSQLDEPIPAPIKPTQWANNDLPSHSLSDEPALVTIENTQQTPSHNMGPLLRKRRNTEREAFFKVRVYDLGCDGDSKLALPGSGGSTQQADDKKWWPNDFYKPKN